MTNDKERDRLYLLKIKEYCIRIDEAKNRFGNSFEAFESDADYRDVVCMNIFQIGELANQLSDELKEETSDIPWHQMYGIRNILAHAYIKIENKVIWETIENDIPTLEKKICEMI